MKKLFCILLLLCICSVAEASSRNHYYNHRYDYTNHHDSSSVYIINRDYQKTTQKFPNCDKHYMETETVINYYSDGTRRTFSTSTIYNSDGSVLVSDCTWVKHVLYNDEHYFLVRKNRKYQVIDSEAKVLSKRMYTKMEEIAPNRLLVKFDKKFGVVSLNDDVVVPIKYQKFLSEGDNVYITKLNGYYGISDFENNVLIKNECEKIKPLFDVFVVKKYRKYGMADRYGYLFAEPKYDSIKKLGEYILVKQNGKYGVFDYKGEKICDIKYKKIRLERNRLEGRLESGQWIEIKNSL